jgi:glycosyltransferase involved in cell wall biosynthesis
VSRLAVIAPGLPAFVRSERHHGPGLRAGHLGTALLRAQHEVSFVCVLSGAAESGPRPPRQVEVEGRACAVTAVTESRLREGRFTLAQLCGQVDAVVGVSALGGCAALGLVGDLPLWADSFGDLMAEAQAKAVLYGNDPVMVRFWGLLHPVLERADRFSAVTSAQADALIGQLGTVGRLSRETASEELVHVIPCAAEPAPIGECDDVGPLRRRLGGDDAFVVLWSGSFNTWCDVDTLFAGVDAAMGSNPAIRFVATGGAVEGHDERTFERFQRLVAASRHRDRYRLEGWVDGHSLSTYYAAANVAVSIELPLYERRLGSENRVAHWLAAGVPVLTTAQSAFGREIVAAQAALRVACRSPEALSDRLCALALEPEVLARLSTAGRRFASERLGYTTTARPLLEWARAPVRSGDADFERLLRVGLVSQPRTMVALLEAYLAELTIPQLMWRSLRWLWRRLARGLRPG